MVEDWTHPVGPGMPTFNAFWHRQVSFESLGNLSQVGRATTMIHIGSHSGTHVDAPSHFIAGARAISDFPADCLMGKIYVLKFRRTSALPLGRKDFDLQQLREFRDNIVGLLFNFGWAKRWGTSGYYSDQPYLTEEAADLIIETGVRFVGYDLAMPDDPSEGRGHSMDSRIHKRFLERDVLLVENVRIPEDAEGFYASHSAPLNLQGVDGSPIRFVVQRAQNG